MTQFQMQKSQAAHTIHGEIRNHQIWSLISSRPNPCSALCIVLTYSPEIPSPISLHSSKNDFSQNSVQSNFMPQPKTQNTTNPASSLLKHIDINEYTLIYSLRCFRSFDNSSKILFVPKRNRTIFPIIIWMVENNRWL